MGKKIDKKEVIRRINIIHRNKFNISENDFNTVKEVIDITCPHHGVFKTSVFQLYNKKADCPKCSKEKQYLNRKTDTKRFVEKAISIHGNKYDYSKVVYNGYYTKVCILCKKHGAFWQTPQSHFTSKEPCSKCSRIKTGLLNRYSTEDFIEKSSVIHNNKYNYSKTKYELNTIPVIIICPEHGEFKQTPMCHLSGRGCKKCGYNNISENNLADFVKSYIHIEQNKRFKNIKEIDIYIPSLNIGIEYNGLYWHSEKTNSDKYHLLKKKNSAKEKNIKLIHIFEDEWLYKEEIVKSRLLNLINKTPNKIYARLCEVKEISNKEAKNFLEQNHIQGGINSLINLGLYYNNTIVSVMTFGKLRKSLGSKNVDNTYELLRFSNLLYTNVIGGASKLFNFFVKNYKPIKIISYADYRWSDGNLYKVLGFKFDKLTKPNYFYIKQNVRLNRFNFTKHKLVQQGFDRTKTESQIMKDRNFQRIFDCGNLKFIYYE